MSQPDRAYISCITTAPQQVPAYLYSTAEIVLQLSDSPAAVDRTGIIIACEALPGNALSVADYQAARLSSGLHGARVHETYQDALLHLSESLVAGKHTAPQTQAQSLTPAAYISPARQQMLRGR